MSDNEATTAEDLVARVQAAVRDALDPAIGDLTDLVAIPSISWPAFDQSQVRRSAEKIAELARTTGFFERVEVHTAAIPGTDELGQPAVLAVRPAQAGRPRVLLYAHHDVQPVGDAALWHTSPFEATERDGRLYGRGTADDKGGLAVHLAALRSFDGRPPVGVTVFVEGEEELGSPTLATLMERHHDQLAADVYVIADSGNWAVGRPAFTTTLRGVADATVTVSTLDHALHSGLFGGVAPDALTTLARLLATLHHDDGSVAVEGLVTAEDPEVDYAPEQLAADMGLLPGVAQLGTGPATARMWTRPAVSVIGLDTTRIADSSNTLIPSASARISMRLAPGQDPAAALDALADHLESHAPWGAHVDVVRGETGNPGSVALTGPYAEVARQAVTQAWGVEPVEIGQGGSIPMVADFQRLFPGATVLITAVSDPDSRMHGIDESLHLGDFRNACVAESLLLAGLPAVATAPRR